MSLVKALYDYNDVVNSHMLHLTAIVAEGTGPQASGLIPVSFV